jgi:hypothetical protein
MAQYEVEIEAVEQGGQVSRRTIGRTDKVQCDASDRINYPLFEFSCAYAVRA